MEQEIWRPIKGLNGEYEVSNMARIRTVEHVVVAKDGRKMKILPRIKKQVLDHHEILFKLLLLCLRQDAHHLSLQRYNSKRIKQYWTLSSPYTFMKNTKGAYTSRYMHHYGFTENMLVADNASY